MFLAIPDTIFIPMPYVYGFIAVIVAVVLALSFKNKKKAAAQVVETVPAPEASVAAAPSAPLAPGSAGKLKLYDTPPKTAAMLMAIVADKLGKPINELRFVSIKEVK